jgi:VanZ family protein
VRLEIKSFWPAILGFIVATMLFCLPGEELPEAGWLDHLHLDKFIHVGLFTMLVVLFCLPVGHRLTNKARTDTVYIWITSAFAIYGVAIEFIQLNFIPHRSFDVYDIVADAVGCAIGFFFVRWVD